MSRGNARGPELGELRRSAEPAVVLSSLARLCVPAFSDVCMVELSEGRQPEFRASYPPEGEPPRPELRDGRQGPGAAGLTAMSTSFDAPAAFGFPAFAGRLVHGWLARSPTGADAVIARLLIANAIEVLRSERVANAAAEADARSAEVVIDSMTSRTIGEGIGVLMIARQLPGPAAEQLLRSMSHRSGRTLAEVALEVVLARGSLPELAAESAARDSSSRRPMHSLRRVR